MSSLGFKSQFWVGSLVFALGHAGIAGPNSSGGGTAVVCRDSTGKITQSEILDLYEARLRYKYALLPSTGNVEGDYLLAVKNTYRLQGSDLPVGEAVRKNFRSFFAITRFTQPGQHLPMLPDRGVALPPPAGCAYEQLAIFYDGNSAQGKKDFVAIDSEIWASLSSQNQAALVSHETFYKYQRTLLEQNSEGSRASVAAIYAQQGPIPIRTGIPPQAASCSAVVRTEKGTYDYLSSFSVFNTSAGLAFQFTQLLGRPVLSRAFIGPVKLALNLKYGDPEHQVRSEFPLVWDKGANYKQRFPVLGSQRPGVWEVEIEYAYRRPMKLSLYERGVLQQETFVTHCGQ